MKPHVLATLKIARETKKLRRDLIVVGGLAEVSFGVGFHTLPSLLRGADYREEWQSLKGLEQASPYGHEDWNTPSGLEEVQLEGRPGVGLLRAKENKSATLSFAFREVWDNPNLQATHLKMDENGGVASSEIKVPNLAKPEHVTAHERLIQELGTDPSSSSIIYESEDFVLRMYFNDHDPPHFHVMAQHDSSETLARFTINTLDQLSQSTGLRPGLRRIVIDWAETRKDALMECWRDCRLPRHPAKLS